ncbi:MAG: hybrid sensor histidine kinase/response regulator, partial [Limisphaerales bacterium]
MESRALKSSEVRFRRLFEAAQDGILLLDPVSRKITDANPYMTQLLGYTRQELLGKELWQIGLLKDEQASHAAFRELQQNGCIRYEELLQTKGREAVQVEFVSNLYKEDDAKVIQCNVRDITRRKRAEEDLNTAIDNLQKAQAVAGNAIRAKDNFLAALSHELRTPLMPVLMAANALIEDKRLPNDVHEQLRMMERNIGLEARLIDDLLDLTAISHGKLQIFKEPCDAHSLISHTIKIVSEEARVKEISIERNFTAKHFGLTADPTRLQQVIWNLMRNAVKFTSQGGRISLQTHDQKAEDGTTWLRIEVIDSGVGIDPGQLEKIFLPFEQGVFPSGHRFGGVGLGLAIAREVVQLHGGKISVRSEGLNQGATFIVELPGAIEPDLGIVDVPSTTSDMPLQKNPPSAAPLRLLLVEDHESTLQTLSTMLERDGHHVVPTSNISQALAAAEAEKFDLVISDVGLPDGSGTELMKQLHNTRGLRGIALSGYG